MVYTGKYYFLVFVALLISSQYVYKITFRFFTVYQLRVDAVKWRILLKLMNQLNIFLFTHWGNE